MMNKILIIDDQFGRCGLGEEFERAVGADIMAAFRADRRNLCQNYGIFDLTGHSDPISNNDAQCEALFCPAQFWDESAKRIENDLGQAVRAVAEGWPFANGSRWALVLLDLAFVCGPLDVFGDPQERTLFGRDVILPELRQKFGDELPIVVLSSTAKEQQNEIVRRAGALDFIQRIPNSDSTKTASRDLLSDMLFLHGLAPDQRGNIVGQALPTLKMLRQARRAARHARTILLRGEIGTGKNLLARYIHDVSPRRDKPFETFNAAYRSPDLQADELFGHWKGAFTGAVADAPGIWERCNGGTILIDEVADLDMSVQQKLMGPIEDRQVSRMGTGPLAGKKFTVDVLTILATNRDLEKLSDNGAIKQDFLSRVHATVIDVPPLRERREDIPELIAKLSAELHLGITLLPDALAFLCAAEWKNDNIRGLRRTLEHLAVSHPGQIVTARDIPFFHAPLTVPKEAETNSTPMSAVDMGDRVEKFLGALQRMPGTLSRDENLILRDELEGVFPEAMAHVLAWTFQLCGNITQAARFLSGNSRLDTSAAKLFIKKILKLDVRRQAVLKAFVKMPEASDGIAATIVRELSDEPTNPK